MHGTHDFSSDGFRMQDHLTSHLMEQISNKGSLLLSNGFQLKSIRKIFRSLKL